MKWIVSFLLVCCVCAPSVAETLSVLIVDGQNNHDWPKTTPELREILEESGRFSVDVATSPPAGGDMSGFTPEFGAYDAIVLNYNGEMWPESTREAFETYVSGGGGVVVVHAADNAFREWPAYNRMIGFGGWGGRTKADGPYIYFRDGVLVYDHESDGPGGGHEGFGRFVVTTRDNEHPITQGMPEQWYQTDELYNFMRGPGGDMHVLATAFSSDPIGKGGSQRHEPMLFTVTYGDGHIFHTTLGHNVEAMQGNGFRVTFARGVEWVATQQVTIAMPEDIPRVLKPHERLRRLTESEQSTTVQHEILGEFAALDGDAAARRELEGEMIAILEDIDTSFLAKQGACVALGVYGTEQSVPALGNLLTQSPALASAARLALAKIDGPMADEALIMGLYANETASRIGIINTLGARRSESAIDKLEEITKESVAEEAIAAQQALAKIGTLRAHEAIANMGEQADIRAILTSAYTLLQDGHRETASGIFEEVMDSDRATAADRNSAFGGLVLADRSEGERVLVESLGNAEMSRMARSLIGRMPVTPEMVTLVADRLLEIPEARQIELLPLIGSMRHEAAIPHVLGLARADESEAVTAAAIEALGAIPGNAEVVEFLATRAANSNRTAGNTFNALVTTPGVEAEEAIHDGIRETDGELRWTYIQAATIRQATSVNPTLVELVRSGDPEAQDAALEALVELGGAPEYAELLGEVGRFEGDRLEQAVAAIRSSGQAVPTDDERFALLDEALAEVPDAIQLALIPALVDSPTDASRARLKEFATDGGAEQRMAAIDTLAKWPELAATETALDIAEATANTEERNAALKAFGSLIRNGRDLNVDDLVAQSERAMELGLDAEGKRVLVDAIADIRDLKALRLLEEFAKDPEVKAQAEAAMPAIKVALLDDPEVTTSHNNHETDRMLDDNENTRWTTGQSMEPGMWLKINLRMQSTIMEIELDSTRSAGDYPRGYEVHVSSQGDQKGKLVASGKGSKPVTTIKLDPPVEGQYITITQTGSDGLWWSVHELSVVHAPDDWDAALR